MGTPLFYFVHLYWHQIQSEGEGCAYWHRNFRKFASDDFFYPLNNLSWSFFSEQFFFCGWDERLAGFSMYLELSFSHLPVVKSITDYSKLGSPYHKPNLSDSSHVARTEPLGLPLRGCSNHRFHTWYLRWWRPIVARRMVVICSHWRWHLTESRFRGWNTKTSHMDSVDRMADIVQSQGRNHCMGWMDTECLDYGSGWEELDWWRSELALHSLSAEKKLNVAILVRGLILFEN